ncbi:MAG: T9SS type A sorting domain-containing protein [candidate division Zixibacteria bacterium]|nr:T9SS type A sorting domain-containing protein [candidate division Zixibacteria bacterium]
MAISGDSYAQNANWSRHFGGAYNEGGFACAATADRGYFVVGSTYSFGHGDHDIYVIRLDSLGDTVWTRAFGGVAADFGRDVQVMPDGGCIVVGSTASAGVGKEDLYLIRISAGGDLSWSRTYGGVNSDEGWSIRWTSDSNFIICGTTSSSGAGYGDLWLLKLTRQGDSIWAKTFGGAGGESGMAARETIGGFVAVGSTGSFGEGYSSIYAVKVDWNGDSVWAKTFGGSKADYGYSVETALDGDYMIVGATSSYGLGYNDAYLLKVTPFGDVVWEKTFGGAKDDRGFSVINSPGGDFILAGTTESFGKGGSDAYVVRVSPIGGLIWSTTYGGTLADYSRSITVDRKGNFVMAGYSYSFSAGGSDMYVVALTGDAPTSVEEPMIGTLPDGFALGQNYPNPFNATTHIPVTLPRRAAISVTIYNLLGQVVRQWNETMPAGSNDITWNGDDERGRTVATGVYLYTLSVEGGYSAKKLVLLK